ncbi:MAG: hypothetical protein ACKV2V_07375 [Blastocatellia bacterium]
MLDKLVMAGVRLVKLPHRPHGVTLSPEFSGLEIQQGASATVRCKSCEYPNPKYARICPMCGRAVITQIIPISREPGRHKNQDGVMAQLRRVWNHSRSWLIATTWN